MILYCYDVFILFNHYCLTLIYRRNNVFLQHAYCSRMGQAEHRDRNTRGTDRADSASEPVRLEQRADWRTCRKDTRECKDNWWVNLPFTSEDQILINWQGIHCCSLGSSYHKASMYILPIENNFETSCNVCMYSFLMYILY